MSIKLNSSGGGSIDIQAPATASNLTVTLPSASGTLADLTSAQTLTNKTLTGAILTNNTANTQAAGDNTTLIANTAFVSALVGGTTTASSSHDTSGYQKLPSGLIIQWGAQALSAGVTAITFPLTFPTACYIVSISIATNNSRCCGATSVTTSGFNAAAFVSNTAAAAAEPIYWIAIGK